MRKLFSALCIAVSAIAMGQTPENGGDLTKLGLEDLMQIKVTTASKNAQELAKVPSAIYVITQEDIRRAGAKNIPDALRLAPGVDVMQVDSSEWMVSIRGFDSRFADKLLVLIDGRSVYTSLFSGVDWDTIDLPMEDIDRIEVIRGPGGSLWGANAVNGVINIITKNAANTVGGLASAEAGSQEKANGLIRYGAKAGRDSFYRVFAKAADNGPMDLTPGNPGPDKWDSFLAGTRLDSNPNPESSLMFEANAQSTHEGQWTRTPTFTPPYNSFAADRFRTSEWNLNARWQSHAMNGWQQSLQAWFEDFDREYPEASDRRNIADFDYQTKLAPFGTHTLTFGAGYRRSQSQDTGTFLVTLTPSSATTELYSAFVHDDWSLNPKLRLSGGVKFEKNSYTGWESQPNVQLLYTPDDRHTWWASVSRAVRTPSDAEHSASVNYYVQPGQGGVPVLVQIVGNPNFECEDVVATELGYRVAFGNNLFLDASAFHNDYSQLRSFQPINQFLDPNPTPHVVAQYLFANQLSGQTDGIEAVVKWKPVQRLSLTGIYSLFSERLRFAAGSHDPFGLYTNDARGGSPKDQFQLRANLDLPCHLEFDNDLYYVSPMINGKVPAYWRLDSRIGWNPTPSFSLSLGVRNALSPTHVEAGETLFDAIEQVEREAYAKAVWRF